MEKCNVLHEEDITSLNSSCPFRTQVRLSALLASFLLRDESAILALCGETSHPLVSASASLLLQEPSWLLWWDIASFCFRL